MDRFYFSYLVVERYSFIFYIIKVIFAANCLYLFRDLCIFPNFLNILVLRGWFNPPLYNKLLSFFTYLPISLSHPNPCGCVAGKREGSAQQRSRPSLWGGRVNILILSYNAKDIRYFYKYFLIKKYMP